MHKEWLGTTLGRRLRVRQLSRVADPVFAKQLQMADQRWLC